MKYRHFFIIAGLALITIAPHVLAADNFVPLTNIPGLTTGDIANEAGLATFFNNLYKYLIGLAAILAVIEIVIAGIEISGASVSEKQLGKERIKQALLGLVLVLAPVLVFSIINPRILNLSLSLPELDTASEATGGGSDTGGGTTIDPATDCSVTGTAGILQIATCESAAKRGEWMDSNCPDSEKWIDNRTNPSNGIVTYLASCSTKKYFIFVDTDRTRVSVINQFRPLVSASGNVSNGAEAMSFANICRSSNLSLQTCVSSSASLSLETPCGLPAGTTGWKCYKEQLTCEPHATLNTYCTSRVDWTPFP